MNKKAEMGVGTLIVFIAMLLVAAVAAGVLITTIGSLQEKSLSTGEQAESQISTTAQTIEVSATDGQNGYLNDFQHLIKLAPGSDPIKLDYVIFTFNTEASTATLKYKGTNGICEPGNENGYNTWVAETNTAAVTTAVNSWPLEEDLDDDGADDYLYIANTGDLDVIVNLSTAGAITLEPGDDIDFAAGISSAAVDYTGTVASGGTTYGTVTIGTTTVNNSLSIGSITVTPYNDGEGYFTAVYEQEGSNHIDGNMVRGDIVRLCYESPENIDEDAEVRLNLIPKIGTATLTMFVTPDVISTERVYLYP